MHDYTYTASNPPYLAFIDMPYKKEMHEFNREGDWIWGGGG